MSHRKDTIDLWCRRISLFIELYTSLDHKGSNKSFLYFFLYFGSEIRNGGAVMVEVKGAWQSHEAKCSRHKAQGKRINVEEAKKLAGWEA